VSGLVAGELIILDRAARSIGAGTKVTPPATQAAATERR